MSNRFCGLLCCLGLILACGCGGDGDSQSLRWNGFLYDPDNPTDRATFLAQLETDGYRIWGTFTFGGFTYSSIEVDGEVGEHYSGNHDLYTDVDVTSDEGIAISFLEFGSGLDDNTTMSGSLTDTGQSLNYRIYTVAEGYGMLSAATGVKAGVANLSSLAVGAGGTIWVFGKQNDADTETLYELDTDGSVGMSHELNPMGATMAWGDDRLWFVTNDASGNALTSYSTSDYSQQSQVLLDLATWGGINTVAYLDAQAWVLTGMVTTQVTAIDPSTGSSASTWSGQYSDLRELAACGDSLVALQWDRSGYLDSIHVYNKGGQLQRSFVVPGASLTKLACDNSHLYTASHLGWILKTPLAEIF